MRQPLLGDVFACARALYGCSPALRDWMLHRLMSEAGRAHLYVQKHGHAHPIWGDGSLMTAALKRRPPPEPSFANADFCRCLASVFSALAKRRA